MLAKPIDALRHICVMAWLNSLAGSYLVPGALRRRMYNAAGLSVATNYVSTGCFLGGADVRIGAGTFVNVQCFFDTSAAIEIGANCSIGMQTMFITSSHGIGGPRQRALETFGRPIVVGEGCWLGARVTVMPGVTIGPGCVIGAGALVTKDCEADGVYYGSPARRVRELR